MRDGKSHRAWVLALVSVPLAMFGWSVAAGEPTVPGAAPAVTGTSNFSELRERGRRAYRADRFDEARDLWTAAAALRPRDAEVAADLALAFQHLGMTDEAIRANRDAIRRASALRGSGERALRIRRAAYFNLGKLKAARTLSFTEENDGPSSCISLASEEGCTRPVFACGRTGAIGGHDGRFDYTAARFALDRETARIVEDDRVVDAFESWADFGYEADQTRDRSDAPQYDVTLELSSQTREPMPGEADATVATEDIGCAVVHVDACARRLGLYCEWASWNRGVTAKPRAKAVELTFARAQPEDPP